MTLLFSQAFLGLFDSFLEFRVAFHELCKGNGIFFLAIAIALRSNGCLSAETLFKSSIFIVLTALTSIVSCVRAPIFLAQRAAFLDFHLFRDTVVCGTTTLVLTFLALFSGFLSVLFWAFSLALEFATTFSTFSRMTNSFLMLWGSKSCVSSY